MENTTEQPTLDGLDWRFRDLYEKVGYAGIVELVDYILINKRITPEQGKEFAIKHKLTRRNAQVHAWYEHLNWSNKHRLQIQISSRSLVIIYSTMDEINRNLEVIRNYEASKLTSQSA
jgi:hypothetical protein